MLPAQPDKSVVLIDNAKYHPRQTGESKKLKHCMEKNRIKDWLEETNIPYVGKDTKPVLLQ